MSVWCTAWLDGMTDGVDAMMHSNDLKLDCDRCQLEISFLPYIHSTVVCTSYLVELMAPCSFILHW
jgi:hypothetical protein